jgi:hypothetical protein
MPSRCDHALNHKAAWPHNHTRSQRHSTAQSPRLLLATAPGEHSCLKLIWAVLDRASAGWRGFTQTPAGLRMLQDLRRSLLEPPTHLTQRRPSTGAAPPETVGAIA